MWSYGRRLAPVVLLVLLLSLIPGGSAPVAGQAPAGATILVDAEDRVTLSELRASGAALLEDYGAFSLWRTGPSTGQRLIGRPSVESRVDFDQIFLRNGAIRPSAGAPPVPAALSQARTGDPQLWLVQFVGPIKDGWLQLLRAQGLEIVHYLPQNAYLVWGNGPALDRVDRLVAQGSPMVWSGPYHPAYRIAPTGLKALQQTEAGLLPVTVQLYTTPQTPQTISRLQTVAGALLVQPEQVGQYTNIRVALPPTEFVGVAAWADVVNIEPYREPTKFDEVQNQIVAGNIISATGVISPSGPGYLAWLAAQGFPMTPSSYPIVDVVDDGIDNGVDLVFGDGQFSTLHPDFHDLGLSANVSRLITNTNCTINPLPNGVAGHGNLNAGIVAGYNSQVISPFIDSGGFNRGLGVSPYGRLNGTKIFSNTGGFSVGNCGGSFTGIITRTMNNGSQISTNSWGADTAGFYTADSQVYDRGVRDANLGLAGNQPLFHVFAAGNAGPHFKTVGSPGTAKNVLTVGATENVRDDGTLDGCSLAASNNADDIASFSSRGPTADGRAKPDIVAPGMHIQGPASKDPAYNGSGVCGAFGNTGASEPADFYPAGQMTYTWSSGTSHSTPAVAGAAQLVWEYYGRVLSPTATPSPAMLKALLVNSARYLTGLNANDALPSRNQGWGDAYLRPLIDGTAYALVDETTRFDNTGEVYTTTGFISDTTKPFRVTLTWSDTPGSTIGNSYVNDLDLEVTAGGQTYRGNVFNRDRSQPGGSFDPRNNIENVFLPAGASGSYQVRVIAKNIAGDGVPNVGDASDQDFALVVSNGVATGSAVPVFTTVSTNVSESIGNGNGRFDPGEVISLLIADQNVGLGSATTVFGTVSANPATLTGIRTVAGYPDLAAGMIATNSLPYRLQVSPSVNCGDVLEVRHVVTSTEAGSGTFVQPLRIGSFLTDSVTITVSYEGPPVPIPDTDTVIVPITVTAPITQFVADLDVQLTLTHTYDDDLQIFLASPSGTLVELTSNNGGSSNNYTGTTFDDEAGTTITAGTAPFTGQFRPETPLSAVDYEPLAGVWTMQFTDGVFSDTGRVLSMTLRFTWGTWQCTPYVIAAPTITSLSPTTTTVASPAFTVTIDGTGFDPDLSDARWDGTLLTTTVLSTTRLLAQVPASLVAPPQGPPTRPVTITVENVGFGISNPLPFTVFKRDQAINFPALPNRAIGDPAFVLNATASSGLTVTFSAAAVPAGACTLTGSTITIVSAGSCQVTGTQAGDGTYLPAPAVSRVFTITAPGPSPTGTPSGRRAFLPIGLRGFAGGW